MRDAITYKGAVYVEAKAKKKAKPKKKKKKYTTLVAKNYMERKPLLIKELKDLLKALDIPFNARHVEPGYTSVMYGTKDHFIQIKYKPYPKLVYEIGAPTGAMGDSVYTRDREQAIAQGRDLLED